MSFEVVTPENLPANIRKRSSSTQWQAAVKALVDIEVGHAISFKADDNSDVQRIRNGIKAAMRAGNVSVQISTRTVPAPTEEHPDRVELYIIKQPDLS
jgi:hypothetical protein